MENDQLAYEQMRTGWFYQKFVGAFFEAHGLTVSLDPFKFRADRDHIADFRDTPDLIVEGERIEVKSRDLKFWTPATFNYARPFVDTVSSYDAYEVKPLAYVFVSQQTGAMVCTPSRNSEAVSRWGIEEHHDSVRDIDDVFYTTTKNLLRTPAQLLECLKNINPKP